MPIGGLTTGANNQLEVDVNGQLITSWTKINNSWVSPTLETSFSFINLASSCDVILPIKKEQNLLINKVILHYSILGVSSTTKYWSFDLHRVSNALSWTFLAGANSQNSTYGEQIINVNLPDIINLNNTIFYGLRLTRVGNPDNLNIAGKLIYQQTKTI